MPLKLWKLIKTYFNMAEMAPKGTFYLIKLFWISGNDNLASVDSLLIIILSDPRKYVPVNVQSTRIERDKYIPFLS